MSNEEWNTLFGELRGFVQEHEVGKEPSFDIIQVARRAHYLSPERYGDEVAPYLLDHGIELGGDVVKLDCHGTSHRELTPALQANLLWVDLHLATSRYPPPHYADATGEWEKACHPHPPTGLIRTLRLYWNSDFDGYGVHPYPYEVLEHAAPSLRALRWVTFDNDWPARIVACAPSLFHLALTGCGARGGTRRVTPADFLALLPIIEGLHTLELVDMRLEQGGVWPRAWERASGGFPSTLALSRCELGGVGIAELMRHPGAANLKTLSLQGCGEVEGEEAGSWRARLLETLECLESLETLELGGGTIEARDVPVVLARLSGHAHLSSVTLSTNALSGECVDKLITCLKGRAFSFLDVKLPADLSLARWLKLLAALIDSPAVHAVYAEASELDIDEGTLSLRGRALTDEACEALIAYPLAAEIVRLDLGGATLSAAHIERILGAGVFTNLRELRIDTATVQGGYDRRAHSGHQRVRFGEHLRDKPPEQQQAQEQAKLRSLSVLNTKVSPETLERWFQNLSRADLGILTLSNVGDGEQLLTWLTGEEGLTSLTHLRLEHNDIEGTSALARLKDSAFATTLKTLSLTHTKLTNQGVAHLLGALPSLSSLTELDLSDNAIDARGLLPLVDFTPPAELTSLKLSGNALGRSGGLLWPRGFYALIEGKLGAQLTSLGIERTDFVKLFELLAETPGFGRLEQLACGSTKALQTHEVASGWFADKDSPRTFDGDMAP